MSDEKQKEPEFGDLEHGPELEVDATKRRPYVKPTYRHEQVFDRMALTCGKVATMFQCQFNRKNS